MSKDHSMNVNIIESLIINGLFFLSQIEKQIKNINSYSDVVAE